MADQSSLPPPATNTQQIGQYTVETTTSPTGQTTYNLVVPSSITPQSQGYLDYLAGASQLATQIQGSLALGAGMITKQQYSSSGLANTLLNIGANPLATPLGMASQAALAAYSRLGSSGQSSGGGTGSYTNTLAPAVGSAAWWTAQISGREAAAQANTAASTMGLNAYGGYGSGTYGPSFQKTSGGGSGADFTAALAAPGGAMVPLTSFSEKQIADIAASARAGTSNQAPFGTFYTPVGSFRQMELQNTVAAVNPISGELGFYQKLPGGRMAVNPDTGKLENTILIGGGGVGAAQSGMFSMSALSPAVISQDTGQYITPRYTAYGAGVKTSDLISAIEKGTAGDLYSRLGAEAYGGQISLLSGKTLGDIRYETFKYPTAQGNLSDLTYRPGVNFAQQYLSKTPWSISSEEATTIMALGPTGVSKGFNVEQGPAGKTSVIEGLESFYGKTQLPTDITAAVPSTAYGLLEPSTKGTAVTSITPTTMSVGGFTFKPTGEVMAGLPKPTSQSIDQIAMVPGPSTMFTKGLGEWGAKYLKSNVEAYQYGQTQGPIVAFGTGLANIFTSLPGQAATAAYAAEFSIRNPSEFGPAFTTTAAAIPGQMFTEATTNPLGFAGGIAGGLLIGKALGGPGSLSASESAAGYTYSSPISEAGAAIKQGASSFKAGASDIFTTTTYGKGSFGNDFGMITPPKTPPTPPSTPIKTIDLTNAPFPAAPKGLPALDLTNVPASAAEFGIYRTPKQAAQLSIDINKGVATTMAAPKPAGIPTFDLTNVRPTASEMGGAYRSPLQAAQLSIDINKGTAAVVEAKPAKLATLDLTNAPSPQFGAYRTPQETLANVIRYDRTAVGAPIASPAPTFGGLQVVQPPKPTMAAATTMPTYDLTGLSAPALAKANAPRSAPTFQSAGSEISSGGQILIAKPAAPIQVIDLTPTLDLTTAEVPQLATARAYKSTVIPTLDLTNVEAPMFETTTIKSTSTKQTPVFDLTRASVSLEDQFVSTKTSATTLTLAEALTTGTVVGSLVAPTSESILGSTTLSTTLTGQATGITQSPFAPVDEAVKPFLPMPIPPMFPSFTTPDSGTGGRKRYKRFNEQLVGVKFTPSQMFGISMKGFTTPSAKKPKKAAKKPKKAKGFNSFKSNIKW